MASKVSIEDKDKILKSLTEVGLSKAVGYLPLYTIYEILGSSPDELAKAAQRRGLVTYRSGEDQCCIKSGALYVYDRNLLIDILTQWTGVIQMNGSHSDPDMFIKAIAETWFEPGDPIMPVIRHAFGEITRSMSAGEA